MVPEQDQAHFEKCERGGDVAWRAENMLEFLLKSTHTTRQKHKMSLSLEELLNVEHFLGFYVPDENEESNDHHDERVLRQCLQTSFAHQSSSLHTHGTEWRLLSLPEMMAQAGLAAEAVVTSSRASAHASTTSCPRWKPSTERSTRQMRAFMLP